MEEVKVNLNQPSRTITGFSSIILDSLRIIAALIVLIYHMFMHWLPTHSITSDLARCAHGGVVIFFVLSGYVIAYTTIKRNRGGKQYMLARFSRLYSIVIPAIAITALIELTLFLTNPELSETITRGATIPRYLLSVFFSNELWFISAAPPINGPLWSLSYEFWYYIIFGLFFFLGKKGVKWLLPGGIACLIAGPKILLMMPIWLLGYLSYKYSQNLAKSASWLLCLFFLLAASLSVILMPALPGELGNTPLFFSGQFITDIISGIFVALALAFMPNGGAITSALTSSIRKAADLTFPIYVLHFPILLLYDGLSNESILFAHQLALPTVMVVLCCIIIGIALEKYRPIWNALFDRLYDYVASFFKLRSNTGPQLHLPDKSAAHSS